MSEETSSAVISWEQLLPLAERFAQDFAHHHHVFTTAESCTGGLISGTITAISGSSQWFDRAFVTYTNEAKMQMLDVQAATLEAFGAVSVQTARQMACGALSHSSADIAVAVTGIAGPRARYVLRWRVAARTGPMLFVTTLPVIVWRCVWLRCKRHWKTYWLSAQGKYQPIMSLPLWEIRHRLRA